MQSWRGQEQPLPCSWIYCLLVTFWTRLASAIVLPQSFLLLHKAVDLSPTSMVHGLLIIGTNCPHHDRNANLSIPAPWIAAVVLGKPWMGTLEFWFCCRWMCVCIYIYITNQLKSFIRFYDLQWSIRDWPWLASPTLTGFRIEGHVIHGSSSLC